MCVGGVQPTYLIFQPHWYLSVTKPSHRSLKYMVFILGASSLDHVVDHGAYLFVDFGEGLIIDTPQLTPHRLPPHHGFPLFSF